MLLIFFRDNVQVKAFTDTSHYIAGTNQYERLEVNALIGIHFQTHNITSTNREMPHALYSLHEKILLSFNPIFIINSKPR